MKEVISLFKKASTAPQKEANILVKKARALAMKNRYRLPKSLQRQFCKHCYAYFKAKNVRVRKTKKAVTYTCLSCNKQMKFPL